MSKMNIRVLFIQRKERYEGQHAPEAYLVEDQWTREENPTWFIEHKEKALESLGDDLAGHAVVEFEVDQDKIRKLCLQDSHTIKAKMVDKQ